MKIIGIGIDLVENARIAQSLEKFGEHFLHRIFCEGEIAYCQRMRFPVPHYAARFAAKEAVSKAFGCGIGAEIGMNDVEVVRGESGQPSIVLHRGAAALATERGVREVFVTLTHTDNYAVAQVLLAGE